MNNCNLNFDDLFKRNLTVGNIPSSYLASLSYEEQLLLLGKDIKQIVQFIDCTLNNVLIDYINNMFNSIMLNTMYQENTETLVLYLENKEVK